MKTECIGDYVKLKGKTYPYSVSLTMDFVGGKWKAIILYHLKDEPKSTTHRSGLHPTQEAFDVRTDQA